MPRKREVKAKEPVRLRLKKLEDGNQSIYLDTYANGKRTYEFLKLYIIPEKDGRDRARNDETMEMAKAIQAKRIIDLKNNEFGFKTQTASKVNLLTYIENVAKKCLERSGNKRSDYSTLMTVKHHVELYAGTQTMLRQVDNDFIMGFVAYLRTARCLGRLDEKTAPPLSANTKRKLFFKLQYVVMQAIKEGGISSNPFFLLDKADKPKSEESKREYLSIDEIKRLIQTDCKNDLLKRAFLFCCLTGLRYSDITKITWGDIHGERADASELHFRQKKTKGLMTLKLSQEAVKWLPHRSEAADTELVFRLPNNDYANKQLAQWVDAAGISKKITFHCSRHSAATLNLTLGTPIEVVSKLLGHKKISTTQIYAKIVNEALQTAVDKQNGIFD